MKKILLAASVIGIAFASCKKSDDNGGGSSSVVGKWNINKQIRSESDNGGTPTVDTMVLNNGSYMEFRSDGKAYIGVDFGLGMITDTGTYKVNGNNLIAVSSTFDTTNFQIISVSGNSLELYDTYTDISGSVTTETKEWSYLSK